MFKPPKSWSLSLYHMEPCVQAGSKEGSSLLLQGQSKHDVSEHWVESISDDAGALEQISSTAHILRELSLKNLTVCSKIFNTPFKLSTEVYFCI
jgi:hypothetical protein